MSEYSYLSAGVFILLAFVAVLYFVFRRPQTGTSKRPLLHYLLLWPIILDADKSKRNGKSLTKREWFGWLAVLLIIVTAVIFT
jgi:integral membrane sensor domain MASE1